MKSSRYFSNTKALGSSIDSINSTINQVSITVANNTSKISLNEIDIIDIVNLLTEIQTLIDQFHGNTTSQNMVQGTVTSPNVIHGNIIQGTVTSQNATINTNP